MGCFGRACWVVEVDTSTYHYKSRRPGQASLEYRIKEICQARVRYGYRRVHVLLQREGWCHPNGVQAIPSKLNASREIHGLLG